MKEIKSFDFKQCVTIIKATGEKAGNIRGLRYRIPDISDESIRLCQGHVLRPMNERLVK